MKTDYPVKLSSARAWRTYVGGSQIDKIHGIPERGDSQFPEEWIISTVIARNSGREAFSNEGLNFVDGTNISLKSLIESYPCKLLGNEHYRKYGAVPGVLIKIIDAGPHKPGFPDTGRHGVTKRREIKLRIDLPLLLTVFRRNGLNSVFAVFFIIAMCADSIEIRECLFLRSSEAHGILDLVYCLRHLPHLTLKIALIQQILRNFLYLYVFWQHHI